MHQLFSQVWEPHEDMQKHRHVLPHMPPLCGIALDWLDCHGSASKEVVLVSLRGMHKTGCCGETRLVLHLSSSS